MNYLSVGSVYMRDLFEVILPGYLKCKAFD